MKKIAGLTEVEIDFSWQDEVMMSESHRHLPIALHSLGEVRNLNLNFPMHMSNLSPLGAFTTLPKLVSLNISLGRCKKMVDIDAIGDLTALTTLQLNLQETGVADVSAIGKLVTLTTLDLNMNETEVIDIGAIGELVRLTKLHLHIWKTEVIDISAIGKLVSLTMLHLNMWSTRVIGIGAIS